MSDVRARARVIGRYINFSQRREKDKKNKKKSIVSGFLSIDSCAGFIAFSRAAIDGVFCLGWGSSFVGVW